jgi:hypothetical protein
MTDTTITLKDMDDWQAFARANAEALREQYGSISAAYQHAVQGGLTLGGGAAPCFFICFEDD